MKFIRALALTVLVSSCAFAQNAAPMPWAKQQFSDQNGVPLAGGYLYTCVAGLACTPSTPGSSPLNPLATYTDSTGTVANPNPVQLDSAGRASIWLGAGPYKIVLTDQFGVTQWTQDQVPGGVGIGTNSAGTIKYTPTALGGQTRTLQSIQGDLIDAGNYDTIQHAIADACTFSPGKLVYIPATIPASQTYTNTCSAPIFDMRLGLEATPLTNRTFENPNINLFAWDASPATSDPLAHGDMRLAPVLKIMTTGSGGESIVPIYTESNFYAGYTGAAYGGMTVLQTMPGSKPVAVAHNWVWTDSSFMPITGCSVTSGVGTCTINLTVGQNAETKTITNPYSVNDFLYISGCSDSSLNTGRFGIVVTAVSSNSVSFSTGHANGSGLCTSGGVLAPSHQAWSFELDQFNNSHDPTSLTPIVAQNNQPVWGITNTSVGNFPITASFFASGGGNSQYNGFVCQDAFDSCFTAGYPVSGGSALKMKYGFNARPQSVATNGTNYASTLMGFTDSTYDAVNGYQEQTYSIGFFPISNSADASGYLGFVDPSGNTYFKIQGTQIIGPGNTASTPTYSFAGDPTSGFYRDSGGALHVAIAGANQVDYNGGSVAFNQPINAKNGIQVNGVSGYTGTITCSAGQHINSLTINNGIITAAPTCN